MKKHVKEFLHRGLLCCAGGPLVLAIIYAILGKQDAMASISLGEAAMGILSITLMAFIAAGISMIYTIEQLPLPMAIAIHAVVLYLDYLLMYLLNSWIPRNGSAIGIFSAVFAAGFALVWCFIYFFTRNQTVQLNRKLPR
ncbi:MAG: DUF3021 domain-containing protein [Oscillospiraceae bacterium]|nr:DUF3021 domain-containing protein [Oscillospiraceae bacterium]